MNCSRSILPIMLMMAVLSPVARAQSTLDRPPTTSTSLQALDGQPRPKPDAIRWIVGVENAERTERAGGFAIWGAQRSLRVSVGIGNTEGPKVTSSADLTKAIVINMRHSGVELPISCELADTGSRTLELDEGGGRHISILVTPRSAPGFQPGTYEFTVSLEKLLASLVLADNTPWPGSAKVESRHQIVLRPVATADDRAAFDQQEANALIALRRPADTIPFVEELTRLRPESWYAWAFLGNTYRRANRLTQAIAAYERSRQGWLGVRSPRNDQIAFELAATYTLAGLETEATMLLRHHGWSEDEIGTRLGQFRSARPKQRHGAVKSSTFDGTLNNIAACSVLYMGEQVDLSWGGRRMDRELARVVIRSLTTASSEVATTAEMLRGQLSDLEFKQYIQAVGSILGAIQLDLMAGILKDFPELDPERHQ